MTNLTILGVCQYSDIPNRIAVYSDAAFDFDLRLDVGVIAHRRKPLTFAFEKLDASDPTNYRFGKRDGEDFLLEQSWNPESTLLQFDLLALVTADGQDDALDGNKVLVTLVFGDERFCYDAGNFWVILG